ncbi:hypothetical protein BS78_01G290500 [Paspalum vaginatum]|nr:hypothetical protein BS78_01G290500 [Paspalum vaginatum]
MIYKLGQSVSPCFEASFHLWNSKGLAAARVATTRHQQQSFQWVQVSGRKSFAQAVSSEASSQCNSSSNPQRPTRKADILTGANRVPIKISRPFEKPSVFDRIRFPRESASVFDRLKFPTEGEPSVPLNNEAGSSVRNSNSNLGASKEALRNQEQHLGEQRGPLAANNSASNAFSSPNADCTRCLAPDHSRISCRWPIKCKACFNFGHIRAFCRNRRNLNSRPTSPEPKVNGPPRSATSVLLFGNILKMCAELGSETFSPPRLVKHWSGSLESTTEISSSRIAPFPLGMSTSPSPSMTMGGIIGWPSSTVNAGCFC